MLYFVFVMRIVLIKQGCFSYCLSVSREKGVDIWSDGISFPELPQHVVETGFPGDG